MHAHSATVQTSNVLPFQQPVRLGDVERLQTTAENQVWQKMYYATQLGKVSKHFALEYLLSITTIKSLTTIRTALAGLVRKQHITVLERKGYRHHGTLYRVQMPHEILALNRDPEYLAEQERLGNDKPTPKVKQPKLPLMFENPTSPARMDGEPVEDVTAPPVESVEEEVAPPVEELLPQNLVPQEDEIDPTENTNFGSTCYQNLVSQKARILFYVLKCQSRVEKRAN